MAPVAPDPVLRNDATGGFTLSASGLIREITSGQ